MCVSAAKTYMSYVSSIGLRTSLSSRIYLITKCKSHYPIARRNNFNSVFVISVNKKYPGQVVLST